MGLGMKMGWEGDGLHEGDGWCFVAYKIQQVWVAQYVWVWLKDDGPTGQTTSQWGDPSSSASSGPSFKIWLKDDGPDDRSVGVVKSVWYCKHIGIHVASTFVPAFWDRQTDREEAMLGSYGRTVSCTKLSNHWFSCIGLYCNT